MTRSRFHLAVFAGFALSLGYAPSVRAQPQGDCNVVAPGMVNQEEAARRGRELTTDSSVSGRLQIGGNVTDFVHIHNLTPCRVTVEKYDTIVGNSRGTQAVELAPWGVYVGNMWVPWADAWDTPQRLRISIEGRSYFQIWQKGDRVAFRTEAELARLRATDELRNQYDSAPSVPGEAAQGGRRHLHIAMTSDGHPFFKVEGILE